MSCISHSVKSHVVVVTTHLASSSSCGVHRGCSTYACLHSLGQLGSCPQPSVSRCLHACSQSDAPDPPEPLEAVGEPVPVAMLEAEPVAPVSDAPSPEPPVPSP